METTFTMPAFDAELADTENRLASEERYLSQAIWDMRAHGCSELNIRQINRNIAHLHRKRTALLEQQGMFYANGMVPARYPFAAPVARAVPLDLAPPIASSTPIVSPVPEDSWSMDPRLEALRRFANPVDLDSSSSKLRL